MALRLESTRLKGKLVELIVLDASRLRMLFAELDPFPFDESKLRMLSPFVLEVPSAAPLLPLPWW